jgi:hypothetical protein
MPRVSQYSFTKYAAHKADEAKKIIERPRRRAVTLVTNGLIGHHREVVELGLQAQFIEKIDFDFHAVVPGD